MDWRPLLKALAWGAGGVTLGIGGWAVVTLNEMQTGLPNLDALRAPLLAALAKHGLFLPEHARAMMAIFHQEHTNGDPNNDVAPVGSGGVHDPMTLGDETLPGGPSVGPGQVYFKTAHELGIWDANDRDGYIAFGSDSKNLWTLVDWAVRVYKTKLSAAHGDVPTAIKLYNGAQSYADSAIAFEAQVFTGGES